MTDFFNLRNRKCSRGNSLYTFTCRKYLIFESKNLKAVFYVISFYICSLLYFVNRHSAELSLSANIELSNSIFSIKNNQNFSNNIILAAQFYLLTFYDNLNSILYFLKWHPIFDNSPLCQIPEYNSFLRVYTLRI